jgi:hypothetical protein
MQSDHRSVCSHSCLFFVPELDLLATLGTSTLVLQLLGRTRAYPLLECERLSPTNIFDEMHHRVAPEYSS